jgi:Aldo/keto reductase family
VHGTFGGKNEFLKGFGANDDVAEARKIIDICMDAGINMFDTADAYSAGQSEEILAETINHLNREEVGAQQKYRAQYSEFKQKEGMMTTENFNRRSLKAAAALGGSSTIAEFGDGMLAQTSTHSATTTPELNPRKEEIAKTPYTKEHAALLIVDPYNDFMSEGGKLFERTKETAMA